VKQQHSRLRGLRLRGPFRRTGVFERLSQAVTDWSGRTGTVVASVGLVLAWAVTGPYFHYSDTWQLVINTLTNLVTFVMVFLIQRSQNKDSLAVQLKLNEIVAALHGASNRLIAIEDLSEEDLRALRERYQRLLDVTDGHAARSSVSIEALHAPEKPAPAQPAPTPSGA
jgi:low affinity Fe/Cu permease